MAKRTTRQYTLDEKREALDLAEEVGTAILGTARFSAESILDR